jgi:hypothetical protein
MRSSTDAGPVFQTKQNGVYDLILSVLSGNKRVGYIRVGISDYLHENKYSGIMKKSVVALLRSEGIWRVTE